jgi:ribose transport system substrate-binding protein
LSIRLAIARTFNPDRVAAIRSSLASGCSARTIGVAMAMLLAITSMNACSDHPPRIKTQRPGRGPFTLGFVNGGTTEFHDCLRRSIESEAVRRGAKVVTENSKQDPAAELTNIDKLVKLKVDAIIVETVNDGALLADIARAHSAGIPIFTTSVAPDDTSNVLGSVLVDLNTIGLLDASWVSNDAVGAEETVGVVTGATDTSSDLLVKGFTDNLPKNIKVVAIAPGIYDRGKAQVAAAKMIQEHPDLTYAFVINEDMAVGVSEAFQAAGKKVKIATVNGTHTGLAAIKDGRFQATVANPASKIGKEAVENTIDLLNKEAVPKVEHLPIGLVVTKPDLILAPEFCLTE